MGTDSLVKYAWDAGCGIESMHGKRDTGLNVCTGSGMSEKTIRMTGLRKNLGQDDGIEEAMGDNLFR